MATRLQIKCIRKSDRQNAHERITHIGGQNLDGTNWRLTQETAIANIEGKVYEFYVNRGGYNADVIVSTSRYGHKYLKTVSDGEQPDNLLSLPECI